MFHRQGLDPIGQICPPSLTFFHIFHIFKLDRHSSTLLPLFCIWEISLCCSLKSTNTSHKFNWTDTFHGTLKYPSFYYCKPIFQMCPLIQSTYSCFSTPTFFLLPPRASKKRSLPRNNKEKRRAVKLTFGSADR